MFSPSGLLFLSTATLTKIDNNTGLIIREYKNLQNFATIFAVEFLCDMMLHYSSYSSSRTVSSGRDEFLLGSFMIPLFHAAWPVGETTMLSFGDSALDIHDNMGASAHQGINTAHPDGFIHWEREALRNTSSSFLQRCFPLRLALPEDEVVVVAVCDDGSLDNHSAPEGSSFSSDPLLSAFHLAFPMYPNTHESFPEGMTDRTACSCFLFPAVRLFYDYPPVRLVSNSFSVQVEAGDATIVNAAVFGVPLSRPATLSDSGATMVYSLPASPRPPSPRPPPPPPPSSSAPCLCSATSMLAGYFSLRVPVGAILLECGGSDFVNVLADFTRPVPSPPRSPTSWGAADVTWDTLLQQQEALQDMSQRQQKRHHLLFPSRHDEPPALVQLAPPILDMEVFSACLLKPTPAGDGDGDGGGGAVEEDWDENPCNPVPMHSTAKWRKLVSSATSSDLEAVRFLFPAFHHQFLYRDVESFVLHCQSMDHMLFCAEDPVIPIYDVVSSESESNDVAQPRSSHDALHGDDDGYSAGVDGGCRPTMGDNNNAEAAEDESEALWDSLSEHSLFCVNPEDVVSTELYTVFHRELLQYLLSSSSSSTRDAGDTASSLLCAVRHLFSHFFSAAAALAVAQRFSNGHNPTVRTAERINPAAEAAFATRNDTDAAAAATEKTYTALPPPPSSSSPPSTAADATPDAAADMANYYRVANEEASAPTPCATAEIISSTVDGSPSMYVCWTSWPSVVTWLSSRMVEPWSVLLEHTRRLLKTISDGRKSCTATSCEPEPGVDLSCFSLPATSFPLFSSLVTRVAYAVVKYCRKEELRQRRVHSTTGITPDTLTPSAETSDVTVMRPRLENNLVMMDTSPANENEEEHQERDTSTRGIAMVCGAGHVLGVSGTESSDGAETQKPSLHDDQTTATASRKRARCDSPVIQGGSWNKEENVNSCSSSPPLLLHPTEAKRCRHDADWNEDGEHSDELHNDYFYLIAELLISESREKLKRRRREARRMNSDEQRTEPSEIECTAPPMRR